VVAALLNGHLSADNPSQRHWILLNVVGYYPTAQHEHAKKYGTYDGSSLRAIANLFATRGIPDADRVMLLNGLTCYQKMDFDPSTLEYVGNTLLSVAKDERDDSRCRVSAARSLLLLVRALADDIVYHDPGYQVRFAGRQKAPIVRAALQAGEVSLSDGACEQMRLLGRISQAAVSTVKAWADDEASDPMLKNFATNEWPNLESLFDETAFPLAAVMAPATRPVAPSR